MKKLCLFFWVFVALGASAQQVLIPYRIGKLWGLADTTGKIKVIPAYDEIAASIYFNAQTRWQGDAPGFFVVKKGNRYGVLRNGVLIMPPKYDRLAIDSMFITEYPDDLGRQGRSRLLLYNFKGQLLIGDSIESVDQIMTPASPDKRLFTVRINGNKSGMFWYDPQTQKIAQWVVKDVYAVRAGNVQNRIFADVYSGPKETQAKILEITFNHANNQYEAVPILLSQVPRREYKESNRPAYYIVKNNFVFRQIEFVVNGAEVLELRQDGRWKERQRKRDTLRFKPDCDSAEVFVYKNFNMEEYHRTFSETYHDNMEKIDSGFEYRNYVILYKKDKKGLIAENVIMPAVYEDIIYFKPNLLSKPFFMVSKKNAATGKIFWGVIDSRNKVIQPVIYDQIIRSPGGGPWILKKDGLFGLADYQGQLVFAPRYEQITPEEHFLAMYIKDKGKYGYYRGDGEFCPPKFPYKVVFYTPVNGYKVYKLVDDENRDLGYADKKGFLYFKN